MDSTRAVILKHPLRTLLLCFAAWKALLLLVAIASPGQGYDTSTSLVLAQHHHHPQPPARQVQGGGGDGPLPAALHHIAIRLTRWDAIYFTQVAARGYRFEQEWAFGWGFTRLIAGATALAQRSGIPYYEGLESIVAVFIAHIAHLLAVLTLFHLTLVIFPSSSTSGFALSAGILHILSPAGLFLSAPYAESSCAFLSFLGSLLFTKSRPQSGTAIITQDILLLLSGVVFGAATGLRSNGILNGLLLLEEALRTLHDLTHGLNVTKLRRLIFAGLGGICVGMGFLLPQYIAYIEYCAPSHTLSRQWCGRLLPSIYVFVQDHYWQNGLFRYWTLSNVPLFLLAAPMLFISAISNVWALRYKTASASELSKSKKNLSASQGTETDNISVLRNLAVSQLLLTLHTFTAGHVQIITRIASSCPVWVWFLAMPSGKGASVALAKNAVIVMVLYGIIQGALFSSFLPPA